ncbi:addiction module toxin RelE [Anaerovorax sp. IOR16]|uniref:addiction module toxin RelE n=1 Tax=Anaerovorax sp. IOR16 TaxID=2773458 RepID=UPI0019CFE2BF|nr:addiction module toxin RelE [Anaerovorax sp. IOR16]
MAKKKYKKMTQKEKKLQAEIRAELREKGIIPPVKQRLNRNKFAEEVIEEWNNHGDIFYLPRALGYIIPSTEFKTKITPEQIGALKVMKLAMEYKKFEEELRARGETSYNAVEFYKKVVAPIINL